MLKQVCLHINYSEYIVIQLNRILFNVNFSQQVNIFCFICVTFLFHTRQCDIACLNILYFVIHLLMLIAAGLLRQSQARAAHDTAVSIRRNGSERIHGMWRNIATCRSHRARSKKAEVAARLSSGGLIYAMKDAYCILYTHTRARIYIHTLYIYNDTICYIENPINFIRLNSCLRW